MKLITYKIQNSESHQIGVVEDNLIYNLNNYFGDISLVDMFQVENYQDQIALHICNDDCVKHDFKDINLLPPIPNPTSFRDAYAFRQHVETSRKNRGLNMISEFDQFPVFYFSNHNTMFADGEEIKLMPDHFEQLDFELEFAIVIGKGGRNILSKDADQHIAGFCILNDLSCRRLQMEEMRLSLGPAKGKDFANVLGPYLVTPDELFSKIIDTPCGNKYDLNMKCFVNGELVSEGNAKDMNWTFAEIIERASYGVELFPGDVIGSGTVGTGCLLEINGSGKRENLDYRERWIEEGDQIEMQIEGLGKISNKIVKSESNHSILKLKK
ncbi:MAG: fumarylacetoacetate hydrolase family protein [Flavobacteriales bacterium]|jgi:fumarylacetoacetate (FAA) hydrolase|nr:fumarylacetoacetate hydrolase family protein [Flavobacteriales bacterium]MBT5354387.1 fumarylacetoacetate hydrolase family protein [Flavobacteriales bacterium]MBT5699061.1 fumarylacetoacetate hydrolase family protein [Flavobacteriales bacterium]